MPGWLRSLFHKYRFRVTHRKKFPKGDLVSFLLNVRDRGFQPKHIIDVGANRAKWSSKAAEIFPECDFTLIEPQTEMQADIERFCSRHPKSRWLQAGAADAMGQQTLTVNPDTVSSTFTMSAAQAASQSFEQRQVPVVTLDHVATQVIQATPELVKIDAEGFECRILAGADKLIGKTELFLLEVPLVDAPEQWSSFAEIINFMAEREYVPYDFTSFQRRPFDGAVGLCELAFARRAGQLRSFGGWAA